MNDARIGRSNAAGGEVGSSMLEVLMAMALVSVVVLGTASLSTVSVRGRTFGQQMSVAVTLIQDKLEAVRQRGYQASVAQVVTQTEPYGALPEAPRYARTVVTHPHVPARGLQTVTVSVAWGQGKHEASMSMILGE